MGFVAAVTRLRHFGYSVLRVMSAGGHHGNWLAQSRTAGEP